MRFQLLGPLSITDGSDTVVLPPSKPTILLASLLLHANTVVSVEYLQRTMWGEEQPATARAALQTCVLRLRRLFVKHGVTGAPIEAVPGGYRIGAGPESLDLIGFRERVGLAAAYAHDPGSELHTLEDALSLWQGPLLANVRSDVLRRDEVPRLAEERLRTVERVCELQLSLGRCGEALVALWGATRAHPGHERFREQLIEALYRSGRQTEALAEYRRVKAYLRSELGVDPSPALRGLELAILRGDDLGRAVPALAAGAPLRPPLPVAAGRQAAPPSPSAAVPPLPAEPGRGAVPGAAPVPDTADAPGAASRRPAPVMPRPDAVPPTGRPGDAPGDDGGSGPSATARALTAADPYGPAAGRPVPGDAGGGTPAAGSAAPASVPAGTPAHGGTSVPPGTSAPRRPVPGDGDARPLPPPSSRIASPAHALRGDDAPAVVPVPPVPVFTGRASETVALSGRLAGREGHEAATVVVSGAPGIGKTALARRVAHLAESRFPGGGYLVRMVRPDGVPLTAREVTAEVTAAVGEPHARGRILLVLDDVLDGDQVLPLLHARPDAAALVTSRRGLAGLIAAHGGWVQRLGPLAEDESYELLRTVLGGERVGAEPDAARALADACCHHPLALRIVTARLLTRPALGLADCAEWLSGDPLARLSLPGSPHMSLRQVLGAALGRLDAGAARAFLRIGAHTTGGLHARDGAALLGLPLRETEDLLERLADAGLLEEGPPGPYRMHDLLRLYARGDDSPSVRPPQKV
ncbi:AfsR/SARP family transcriptional regulator [Streptomyces marianii]|uniref:AfsR family transcriptional regulator n=1 Tax=Streptomyces marianii TaxID=1817406 RepID=A0A5R9E1U3_9ACTN|nr:BTAD domain-containing putative transcriptional regulator [Streptomyces marianii]TLQ42324.1 AfsR family transcriptional regulator [Streptomyces marianii]